MSNRVMLLRTTPIFLLFSLAILTSCNPLYVLQAGITQSEILLNRRQIEEVISDSSIDREIQRKLVLVNDARSFSFSLSLDPQGSFQSYSALDRDILAWIVMGAKPDSFELKTWWFPIVGSVPYKGYFSPDSAECAARRLRAQGYETLVRGTEAFSTLGWFDDPVMTPMLRNPDHEIVNTVLHEILHTTLWVPGYVAFNESLANFIGLQGAIAYYQQKLTSCNPLEISCTSPFSEKKRSAEIGLQNALAISKTLSGLISELSELYSSTRSREEKLALREAIFIQHLTPLRQRIPGMKILKKAHNGELLQLQLYYSKLDLFSQLWDKHQGSWRELLVELQRIATQVERDGVDPFVLLSQSVS